MDIFFAVPGAILELGKHGSHLTRAWRFDCRKWFEEYPDGVVHILHRRPGDADALPVSFTVLADKYVDWAISRSDVENVGTGECEIIMEDVAGHEAKSMTYTTRILNALSADDDEPPAPHQGWVEDVLDAATGIVEAKIAAEAAQAAAETAQGLAETAQAAAETAQGLAETAQAAAETAQTGAETAQGLAETAQTAAETAQAAAETAQGLAEDAQTGAEMAQGLAETAQAAAETAQAAAEAAQTAAETAQTGAETAKTGAETAQAAAESALGDLIARGGQAILDIQAESQTQIGLIDAEGATQVAAVGAKGAEVIESIPSDYTELEADVGNLKSALNDITGNTVIQFTDGYIATNGATVDVTAIVPQPGWKCAVVNCSEGDIFTINGAGGGTPRLWCFITSNGNVINNGYAPANTTKVDFELSAPANSAKLVINSSNNGICYYGILERKVVQQTPKIHDEIRRDLSEVLTYSANLFDKDTAVDGYLNDSGEIVSSSSYKTNTKRIYVHRGQNIAITAYCRRYAFFNYTDKQEEYDLFATATDTHIMTAPNDGYYKFTVYAGYVDTFVVVYGDTVPSTYIPYSKTFTNGVDFNEQQIALIQSMIDPSSIGGNILYGKKWVACGDSFTHGDFTNSPTDDYTFTEGLYSGEYKVYPFWIGRRNSMTIINEAQNGSTMADTGNELLSFANTRYKSIPSDADYITLYFGINDSEQGISIGTESSTDVSTFWGAWNVTLNYIIRNHPDAHIGIIIPNRATVEYCEVIRDAARKWGLPFLDLSAGEQVPLVLYANGKTSVVDSGIANFRNDHWLVKNSGSGGNFHPNALAHEYESTFIEDWLRGL